MVGTGCGQGYREVTVKVYPQGLFGCPLYASVAFVLLLYLWLAKLAGGGVIA